MFKNKLLLTNLIIASAAILVIVGVFWVVQNSFTQGPKSSGPEVEQAQQNGTKTAKKAAIPEELKIRDTDHVWGDKKAPVQIVVYEDFECPFCLDFYKTIEKVKTEFDGKVAIVFRHFPLRSHAHAMPAAQAAECAGEQGKFWEMAARIFDDNEKNIFYTEKFSSDAKDLGLNTLQYENCISNNTYLEKIAKDSQGVKQFGVIGAPAFFVNGIVYPGALPMDDYTDEAGQNVMGLRSVINEELGDN